MERRRFLQQSALASGTFLVPSFVKASEGLFHQREGFRRLVVIQLSGGNDGLNTIVPHTNDIYYGSRPKIAIKPNELIKVNDVLGFHPSLEPLVKLYDRGHLCVLNSVGYPNPDRSHFRSTDIWHTASDSDQYLTSGWVGRYMEAQGKKPHGAIEIDDSLSLMLKGEKLNGIATTNPKLLYRNMNTPFFKQVLRQQTDEHLSEHNLGYLYRTMIDAKSSAKYIHETTKTVTSKKDYPNNPFGKQLKTTAEFINSGLDTKVYYVSMGGFDTHANQINSQSRLLAIYAEAMASFVSDLEANNTFGDTLIMTFSEFGRRVRENASWGTDHGAANNVFVIGKDLKKPGFYNQAPDLTDLDANKDIKHRLDFREVYATILDNWLGVPHGNIIGAKFDGLGFV
ncbi:DUF1501 domain-containing protein [Maribacter sp. 2307ULW6-5]|uniref:DUF1501 domain-containing protein n=1 Tax=Maribacter sp. 2307ULW6-5 TaxID=3386275 RepID=UPI0039BD4146